MSNEADELRCWYANGTEMDYVVKQADDSYLEQWKEPETVGVFWRLERIAEL